MELLDLSTLLMKCPVLEKLSDKGYQLVPSPAMQLGIDFHNAIAEAVQGKEWKETVRVENEPLIDYLVNRAMQELNLLFHYNAVEVEKVIHTDFGNCRLAGIVDLILHTDQGLVLIDWKTTQRDFKQSPLQLNTYRYILEKEGNTVVGTYYIKVRFKKYRSTYTAEIIPVVCPFLPTDLIHNKIQELMQIRKVKQLPALENCGFCPLQDFCEPVLQFTSKPDEIAEHILEPAREQNIIQISKWKEQFNKVLGGKQND